MPKNSERFILELEEKVCEISHKYQKLSPVEKAEVEKYLRIRLQGGCVWLDAGFIEKVIYWMRYWQIIDGMHHLHFQKNYFLKMKMMHICKKWCF